MTTSTTIRRGTLVGFVLALALVLAACVAPIPVVPVDENPPTVAPLADRSVLRNTVVPRSVEVAVAITDPDDDGFTVAVEADDAAVLAPQSVPCTLVLCTLTLTPSPDATATVTVTVTVTSASEGVAVVAFELSVVPTLVGSAADDGAGSLRQALADAEAGDVLSFDADGAFATPQTILLESQLVLDRDVTVEGLGRDPYGVTISAAGAPAETRLFAIVGGVVAVLRDLRLDDGLLSAGGEEDGGALFVGPAAELTLIGSRLRGNRAVRGGALFNDGGTVVLDATSILGSVGGPIALNADEGGGIFNAGGTLTLRNGSAVAESHAGVSGGGIHHAAGALTIEDSTLSGNSADEGGGLFQGGGSVAIVDSTVGDPDPTDAVDEANTSSGNGAGIYSEGDAASAPEETTLTLDGSRELGNRSDSEGGGIYGENALIDLRASRVSSNLASDCGGMWFAEETTVTIEDSTIGDPDLTDGVDEGNIGTFYGGGLCRGADLGTVTLVRTVVAGNRTDGDGGGLYLEGGTLHVTDGSLVVGNSADRGGGIFVDPDDDPSELIVDASTVGGADPVDANSAVDGGGIFHAEGVLEVRNGSLIVGNDAELGGGIHQFGNGTTTTIRDSTIGGDLPGEGNRATLFGGGIYLDGGGGPLRGTMTLIDSRVIGNDGDADADDLGFGGGIYSDNGALTLEGTEVSSNSAHQGGGIYNASVSFLDLDAQTSVVGNTATQGVVGASGGGIYDLGTIVSNEADVSGNSPDDLVAP